MDISIIIPAYNEEDRIEPNLQHIISYLKLNFNKYEIIIIDDCSTDRTNEIVSKYTSSNIIVLKNDINRGKGYSVKRGILKAKYPLVLFSDSDLATPIEELEKFIGYIDEGYDIVIASRNLKESIREVKQPLYRQYMGRMYPKLVELIVVKGFKDTQCGFKLFKTDLAKKIVRLQTFERFSFDVEILFIANKLGYKVKEAPVTWIDQEGTKVRFLTDGFSMLLDLFRIRYNYLFNKYMINHQAENEDHNSRE